MLVKGDKLIQILQNNFKPISLGDNFDVVNIKNVLLLK